MRALLWCALLLAGCAGSVLRPQGVAIVFEETSVPLEWRTDLGPGSREVHGEACRNAIGFPLFIWGGRDLAAWSDAGYRDAVAQAQAQAPGATLTDVRVDARFRNILVWRQECLEVTASARTAD